MSEPRRIENALLLYRRFFVYVRRYWPMLVIAIFASMLYSGIDSSFIYFLKPLINKGLVEKNHHFLHWAPILIIGFFLLRGLANFLSTYCLSWVSTHVIMKLRQDVFSHLLKIPARYYDHSSTGKILSIIIYSVDQISNASADVIASALQSIFMIIGLIVVMALTSWKLTLSYFIILPLVALIARMTSLRVRRLSLSIQDAVADVMQRSEENIEGYKVVRGFGGEDYEVKKFNKATRLNRLREMKVVIARSISAVSVQVIAAMAVAVTLYVATVDISNSILSPGGFVVMVASMIALLKPMKDLTGVQNKLYRALAAAQSIFEFFDQPTEEDLGHYQLTHPIKGKISFSNVNFSYSHERPILRDISFTIEPGELVALVGRSGSGKSTLINLLPRYYSQFTGEILLDNRSIRDYRLTDLRKQFAMVSQHIILFNDTVANNIAYGCLEKVDEAAILSAAKMANALEFIQELPKGIHTLIGENGVLLSGGQRQRIAIARAILKNAPILILDEATSALDTESERAIQDALDALMKTRTTLVIAHRLSTIEKADKIIVLEQGNIIEMATHRDLLSKEGHYAKLYHGQLEKRTATEVS